MLLSLKHADTEGSFMTDRLIDMATAAVQHVMQMAQSSAASSRDSARHQAIHQAVSFLLSQARLDMMTCIMVHVWWQKGTQPTFMLCKHHSMSSTVNLQ